MIHKLLGLSPGPVCTASSTVLLYWPRGLPRDPDVAPGAEPLVDSSPGTATAAATAAAAAAAAAAGVEVVSAPNREGTRDPLILRSICFRRRI